MNKKRLAFLIGGACISGLIYVVFGIVLHMQGTASRLFASLALVWLAYSVLTALILLASGINGRMKTIGSMFASIAKYAAILVSLFWGLSILGVNTTAVLASAGVVTLVIGFGAQSLIEDVITGIFIIFEGQYKIGDILVLDNFRGSVVSIGVRTTTIEDAGGNRQIVNNSDIRNFQNRSKKGSVAISDISISYEQDLEALERLLDAELPKFKQSCADLFEDVPKFMGIQSFDSSGILLRFCVSVREENIFKAQRALNRQLKLMFDKNKISIPYTQVVVHDAVAAS
ncbi:MAG: mechanosensitive ion channel [Oscillospiraceae bacterium]|nr:mechanosensitive ion channel [Oscillospiraceae bacterium]